MVERPRLGRRVPGGTGAGRVSVAAGAGRDRPDRSRVAVGRRVDRGRRRVGAGVRALRSGTAAAQCVVIAYLLSVGTVGTVAEGERRLRSLRPGVRLHPPQARLLHRFEPQPAGPDAEPPFDPSDLNKT